MTLETEPTAADAGNGTAPTTTTRPEPDVLPGEAASKPPARRRRAATRPAGPPQLEDPIAEPVVAADPATTEPTGAATPAMDLVGEAAPVTSAPRKRASRKKAVAKKAVAPPPASQAEPSPAEPSPAEPSPAEPSPAEPSPAEPSPAEPSPAEPSPAVAAGTEPTPAGPAEPEPAPRRRRMRKAAAAPPVEAVSASDVPGAPAETSAAPAETSAAAASSAAAGPLAAAGTGQADELLDDAEAAATAEAAAATAALEPAPVLASAPVIVMPLFQAPVMTPVAPRRRRAASRPAGPPSTSAEVAAPAPASGPEADDGFADAPDVAEADVDLLDEESGDDESGDDGTEASRRRRRRRGGRGRRGRLRDDDGEDLDGTDADDAADPQAADGGEAEAGDDLEDDADAEAGDGAGSRRRRRRRRRGNGSVDTEVGPDDPPNTVVRVREARRAGAGTGDDVTGVRGSTRLEAKKLRRREGREAGRRRPVITEAEFLARRESVERVMVVRERDGRTQIGVLEDGVLVEHYVARRTQTSSVGNVYLGRVQNVLPSMEAAFVDIGKGRNAVLYAGEVNWDAAGLEGQPKRIEHALRSGESVLVQVTKDPIGHKGARLTSQVSLPGRYLVYVPDGSMTGISRKLPDTERARLKKVLREVVPENAGVIVRTAAEGASEEELARDVTRLQAQWEDISRKASAVNAPNLLYGEPDLAIRVVRDIFNEDFGKLIISGGDAWDTLQGYIGHVAPDLVDRLERWPGDGDAFGAFRIDEQLAKGLERKVWLPSGGSLVIDRTEAMTVVDVNTGKFTGAGGNLEETVTKNNLEAAEEIVRQLRLRDIGGIIVVDFIDMVLESNRELVLRRLLECLGRDRTKHQVAEVTSLGLVQMTRKRVGSGLLEVFSETCEHCGGRGVIIHTEPVEKRSQQDGGRGRGGNVGGGNAGGGSAGGGNAGGGNAVGADNAGGGSGSGAAADPAPGNGSSSAAASGSSGSSGASAAGPDAEPSSGGRSRRRRSRAGSAAADTPNLAAGS